MKTSFAWRALLFWLACPIFVVALPQPYQADVAYGTSPAQKLDIYEPAGKGPFPFVMFIHAGGWWNGDKKHFMSDEDMKKYLDAGIAVVSINYRFLPEAKTDGLFPPVLGPYTDSKRALQTVRFHAKEWNLDPAQVALSGESAGACTALWLGLSPEMADPTSADPIDRMSTRVLAIAVKDAQTSLDPQQMRAWVGPELAYGGHAYGLPEGDFAQFLQKRPELEKYFSSLSPAALLGPGSPPVFLQYNGSLVVPEQNQKNYFVHSPAFGVGFQKLAQEKGATCYLAYKDHPADRFPGTMVDFLIQHLTAEKGKR
jgi:acetyl esterase/lipase